MYERMKRLLSGETAEQQLLVPDILNVTAAQAEAAEAHAAEFAALGFALTRLAPDQLALRGVPSLLAGEDPAGVVRDVLSDLARNRTLAPCRGIDQPAPRHHGLPRGGARPAHAQHPGDERAAARDGAHRSGRSVQSRPPDLGAAVARGSRSAVHARALMPREAQAQKSSGSSGRRSALLLMGPTGAGKSELALDLARRFPFEIVSVDSAQVYRGMDIGTAKPDLATRARIPHHLIDIRDPEASYSGGRVRARCERGHARDLGARATAAAGRRHDALFSRAHWRGIAQLPEADAAVRAQIDAQAAAAGWAALHEELARVDPAAAARIHVNDPQRIQRALEVYRVTGEPITRLQQIARAGVRRRRGAWNSRMSPAGSRRPARENRGALRGHVGGGLVGRSARACTKEALSPRNIRRCARSDIDRCGSSLQDSAGLEDSKKQAVAATRQLAKRQLTWLEASRASDMGRFRAYRSYIGVSAMHCPKADSPDGLTLSVSSLC